MKLLVLATHKQVPTSQRCVDDGNYFGTIENIVRYRFCSIILVLFTIDIILIYNRSGAATISALPPNLYFTKV